ncbi:Pentatricopeptide repeat-containing protein [Acorus gramineus]|uniref:Pentatricopeptide repeat-containing protein n=1 Tax=Acorus gramineus TaxID=55184 RepID=A0AAV9AQA9_ACOGR|nr:Pentatricopeptide repeat-containing protein [Acorus gramineus]
MLASLPTQVYQSKFQCFLSLKSSPPIGKENKSGFLNNNNNRRNPKRILKSPCFSFPDPSIPSQTTQNSVFDDSNQNPDASIYELLDPDFLSHSLRSCSTLREVKRLHAVVLKGFRRPVTFVDNNLISTYVRFMRIVDAERLFDGMRDRDVVSWTAMITAYSKTGMEDEVLRVFERMVEDRVVANGSTYVCLLNSCSRRSDFDLGRQVHACVVKESWSNLIVNSTLVHFYARCGDLEAAFRLFDSMPKRDVVSWTTMVAACAQHGRGGEALSLFARMQREGVRVNEFTVCSALKACGESKDLKFGRQLHGASVKKALMLDVFIGSSLVGMYVKCGQVVDARAVFDSMPRRNTVSWTSMIAGYAQNGVAEEAINLFRRMKKRRILTNSLTVVSILSACGSIGLLCLGKEIHSRILKNFTWSNTHIGTTLVWFYSKCGEYKYASRVLKDMPLRDVFSWTAIISGYTQNGIGVEALGSLSDMMWEGVNPNPFTYSSALKACAKLEAIREGQWIHASANKTCALANVFVGSALIDMYAKCGCVTDASRVFDLMPERNLVSWKSMIVGYARNGLCKEALKLVYRMRAEGFKVEDYVLSEVFGACGDVESDSVCSLVSSETVG